MTQLIEVELVRCSYSFSLVQNTSQLSFTDAEYRIKRKPTRREFFWLRWIRDRVVPWKEIEERIEPFLPKAGNGSRSFELSAMVRIHFLQQVVRAG